MHHSAQGRTEVTYADLDHTTTARARQFAASGIGRGDVVSAILPTSVEFVECYYGALKVGAPFAGINPGLTDHEIRAQITHSTPGLLVVDAAGEARLPDVFAGLTIPPPPCLNAGSPVAVVDGGELTHPVDEADVAAIVYTSGTEGTPKGVMLTHRNFLIATTPSWVYSTYLLSSDVFLLLAPAYTMAGTGTITNVVSAGARAVMLAELDYGHVLDVIPAEAVTATSQTPTFYRRLVETPGFGDADLGSLRQCHVYGGAIDPDVIARFNDVAPHIEWAVYWGQSELTQLGCVGYFRTVADLPGGNPRWIGRPMAHVEVRIADDDGADASYGELLCRSPGVMLGYYRAPELTERVITDGWLRTGDIVSRTSSGDLFFEDRQRDIVKSGGMNISTSEVEAVLRLHPSIDAAAVVGIPDSLWSERLVAAVVLVEAASIDVKELSDFCRSRLASYKVPKDIHVVDALPYDEQGKLRRRVVRDLLERRSATATDDPSVAAR